MRDGTSKLAQQPPEPAAVRHTAQVLQFRPRERLRAPHPIGFHGPASELTERESESPDDLAFYEQDRKEEDDGTIDYPHRMLMNVIAVVIVTALIGVGVWLADTIADMERDQDCVLQGRQNCMPIEVAIPQTLH